MKANKLQQGYFQFGNKGAVFTNKTHIALTGTGSTTLCGTPMLSSNWATIDNHDEIGCPKCLAIYGKPNSEEWNLMMKAIKQELGKPIMIPERFGKYMINEFTNCLPPIVWDNDYVLCSEPYDCEPETDKDRFIGFYKKDNIYYGIITTVVKFNQLR